MLVTARHMGKVSFGALMHIYRESNLEHGFKLAPWETEERQLQLAEQDFYSYLQDDFFTRSGAEYCVWVENERYVSALRLEPYRDGLLLEALETAPDARGRGYAVQLIQAVQRMLEKRGDVRIYSHVDRKNEASLKVHRRCGFAVYREYAAFVDGSVSNRSYTLRYEKIIPKT